MCASSAVLALMLFETHDSKFVDAAEIATVSQFTMAALSAHVLSGFRAKGP